MRKGLCASHRTCARLRAARRSAERAFSRPNALMLAWSSHVTSTSAASWCSCSCGPARSQRHAARRRRQARACQRARVGGSEQGGEGGGGDGGGRAIVTRRLDRGSTATRHAAGDVKGVTPTGGRRSSRASRGSSRASTGSSTEAQAQRLKHRGPSTEAQAQRPTQCAARTPQRTMLSGRVGSVWKWPSRLAARLRAPRVQPGARRIGFLARRGAQSVPGAARPRDRVCARVHGVPLSPAPLCSQTLQVRHIVAVQGSVGSLLCVRGRHVAPASADAGTSSTLRRRRRTR